MSAVEKYLHWQDGLSDFIGRVISVLTLVLIGVLLFEVVSRYFLNAPTIWAHELSTMLFGAFCILAGSYTLRHNGHVRSEVIYGYLPERVKAFLDVIVFLIGMVVLIVFFRMAVDFAASSWASKEFSAKSIWQPPIYPVKTVIPVAVGLLILQNFAELVRSVLRVVNPDFHDPRVEEHREDDQPNQFSTPDHEHEHGI